MKRDSQLLPLALSILVLVLLTAPTLSQPGPSAQPPALLETVYLACSSGVPCGESKVRVYADGRYVAEEVVPEEARSGRYRLVSHKAEKQLEAEEVAEIVGWAEQPDFLQARPEYYVARAHHGHSFTIVYRNKGREQEVRVVNYRHGNAEERAKVPPSVVKLLRWVDPYYFEWAEKRKD